MSRLAALVASIGAAGAFGALAVGAPLLATPFVVVAFGGMLWSRGARRTVPESGWTAPLRIDNGAKAQRRAPASARRVGRALARVEARELALHPWFGAGIGLCVFMVIGFGLRGDAEGTWEDELQGLTFLAHPLVGTAVLAAHAAATRWHRSGTVELFDVCPAAPSTRALGVLASMWVPAVALAVFFAAYVGATTIASDLTAPTGPVALHVASGLTLGAGGVALGVALARFSHSMATPVVALVIVGFVSLRLAETRGDRVEATMVLSTFPPVGDSTPLLSTGHMAMRLLWLVGLTVATAALAVSRLHAPRARHAALVEIAGGA